MKMETSCFTLIDYSGIINMDLYVRKMKRRGYP